MYEALERIDLSKLVTFRTFAELGTVAATADRLGRTQPAISSRLHLLESELGRPVLVRVGRKLELTPFGRQVCEHIDQLVPHLQRIADLSRQCDISLGGLVRVGALPTAAIYSLMPRFPTLHARHPNLRVQLEYGDVATLLERLERGSVDLVLAVGGTCGSHLERLDLDTVRAVRVKPARGPAPTQWVAYGPSRDPFFDAVWRHMVAEGFARNVSVQVSHIQTLKLLVAQGIGQCILPSYTVTESDLATESLLNFDHTPRLWCATRKALTGSPAMQAVIEVLTTCGL